MRPLATVVVASLSLLGGLAVAQEDPFVEEQAPLNNSFGMKVGSRSLVHRVLTDETPVHLPWSEVVKLLENARKAHREAAPWPFALGTARAEGECNGRLLNVRLSLSIQLLDDEWTAIPLLRDPVGLRKATLDGKPAPLASDGGELVLVAKGRGVHELAVELVLSPSGGLDLVQLGLATPVAIAWSLKLPGAAAHIEPAVRQATTRAGAGLTLEALTAPSESVRIDWTGEKAASAPARVSAESFTYVTFQEGNSVGRANFSFQLTGGSRDRFVVRIPPAMELLTVEGKDLASWVVEGTGDQKKLSATFARPQRTLSSLTMSFELPKPLESASLPALVAEDVVEQHAWVAASAESPLSIAPESLAGGEAVDVKRLPTHLMRGLRLPFTLAYRHSGEGFAAQVRIARHGTVVLPQATIDAAYFTTVLTDEGQEVVKATFLVKNNLRLYLKVALPQGASLWAAFVSGESVSPGIEEGKVLLPLVKSRGVGEGGTLAVHQVESGWSLSDLALQYYHDASKWKTIQAANEMALRGNAQAYAGQSLVIPRLSAANGADLETAFPVELVYSREGKRPGFAGGLDFELPTTDLDIMNVQWTVYLPSRLDPLEFSGNLTQASYLRYGLLRRLRQYWRGPMALMDLSPLVGDALAGSENFRTRFKTIEAGKSEESEKSYPRVSLPLVGRPYVFKKLLMEGEAPKLGAAYLDRRAEAPVRWGILGLAFAVALWLTGAARRARPALGVALPVSAGLAVLVLGLGHFVLGVHGRALLGLVLGGWFSLVLGLFLRPLPEGRFWRFWHRLLRYANAAVLALVVLLGVNLATGFLAVVAVIPAAISLLRSSRRLPMPPAAAAVAGLLLLGIGVPSLARAQDLPGQAQVTVPFGRIKDLAAGPAEGRRPARAFTILSAEYSGTLVGESLTVDGKLEVELHADGWANVPLIARGNALSRLIVDGKPGAARDEDGRYAIGLRGAGLHTIDLTFAVRAEPGSAVLDLVPGVAGSLTVRLPSAGLEPEVTPANEVKVDGAAVHALLTADGHSELLWTPAAVPSVEGAKPAQSETRVTARTIQIVSADDQRVRIFALIRYRAQRGGTNRFAVQLPEGVELLEVAGDGIAEHEVVTEEGKSVLNVTTSSMIRDAFELSFAYDWRPAKAGGMLPTFVVKNVRSESGTIGVESAGNLEIQLAGVDGAAAIDVHNAPELLAHTDKPILHAIRYLQHPYSVRLAFAQHPEAELEPATVDHASYTTVLSRDGRAMTKGVYRLRNARRSFMGISLPSGGGLQSELQSVIIGGEPAKPVKDAQGGLLLPLMRSPSSEREMRQFEVEVVYLTKLPATDGAGALPGLLPSIDLRISTVSWELYLPFGTGASSRVKTEQAADHMQWATAPRALWARSLAPRGEGDAIASGGILPVRFNLPEHGAPEKFWMHYLPAGAVPTFKVSYSPRSLGPVAQALLALLGAGALVAAGWALSQRRRRSA